MPLIELINVTKRYKEITALDHICFSVEDGEYLTILGPTGAGKTTLLRVIAGLLEPDKGDIYIEGRLMVKIPPEERNTFYMYQQYALFPHMNVWENVSFGLRIKDWKDDRINMLSSEILEMVRLGDRQDAFPDELSGGMQQRVALARGIVSGARVLLLDEPFGALDARLRVELRSRLKKLVKDQGLTVLHVTHDQEEALTLSDRILILRNGKIEQIGTPREIYAMPKSIFVTSFVGGANFFEGTLVKTNKTGSVVEIQGGLHLNVSTKILKMGNRVVLAVRPENTLIKSKKFRNNNLRGSVQSVRFIGSFIEYVVKLENNFFVISKIPISELKVFKKGDEIFVSFCSQHVVVFPYPDVGLLKEIEAI